MENAIHWPFSTIYEPEDERLQGEMGDWRVELRFSVPQV